jgi:hypothetical protein
MSISRYLFFFLFYFLHFKTALCFTGGGFNVSELANTFRQIPATELSIQPPANSTALVPCQPKSQTPMKLPVESPRPLPLQTFSPHLLGGRAQALNALGSKALLRGAGSGLVLGSTLWTLWTVYQLSKPLFQRILEEKDFDSTRALEEAAWMT